MACVGYVKFFNDAKGFGFIARDDGGDDLFVHRSDLNDNQALVEGDEVWFDDGWNDRQGKAKADNCTGGSGGSLDGGGGKGGKGKYDDGFGKGGGKGKYDDGYGYGGKGDYFPSYSFKGKKGGWGDDYYSKGYGGKGDYYGYGKGPSWIEDYDYSYGGKYGGGKGKYDDGYGSGKGKGKSDYGGGKGKDDYGGGGKKGGGKGKGVCFAWQKGHCDYGDTCKYRHE